MSINFEKVKGLVDQYTNVDLPQEFQQIYRDWFYRMYNFQKQRNTVELKTIQEWLLLGLRIVKIHVESIFKGILAPEKLEQIKQRDWYEYESKRRANMKVKKEIVQLIGCVQDPVNWLFVAARDYQLLQRGSEMARFIHQYNDLCRLFAVETLEVPSRTPRR